MNATCHDHTKLQASATLEHAWNASLPRTIPAPQWPIRATPHLHDARRMRGYCSHVDCNAKLRRCTLAWQSLKITAPHGTHQRPMQWFDRFPDGTNAHPLHVPQEIPGGCCFTSLCKTRAGTASIGAWRQCADKWAKDCLGASAASQRCGRRTRTSHNMHGTISRPYRARQLRRAQMHAAALPCVPPAPCLASRRRRARVRSPTVRRIGRRTAQAPHQIRRTVGGDVDLRLRPLPEDRRRPQTVEQPPTAADMPESRPVLRRQMHQRARNAGLGQRVEALAQDWPAQAVLERRLAGAGGCAARERAQPAAVPPHCATWARKANVPGGARQA